MQREIDQQQKAQELARLGLRYFLGRPTSQQQDQLGQLLPDPADQQWFNKITSKQAITSKLLNFHKIDIDRGRRKVQELLKGGD